jgi:hypothetical protein
VIEVMTTLAVNICDNCGDEIHLLQGDLSRDAEWVHFGTGWRWCWDAPLASPGLPAPAPTEPTERTAP